MGMVPECAAHVVCWYVVRVREALARADARENVVARRRAVNVQAVRVDVCRVKLLEIIMQARGVVRLGREGIGEGQLQRVAWL